MNFVRSQLALNLGILFFLLTPFVQVNAIDVGINTVSVDSNVSESSSSKRLVHLFESPLSASVLTSEQILRSGATSIPEALRLMPGLLVRELTNGQYDVHIRGFENAPVQEDLTELNNQNSLVMIDGRVVYEYFLGGVFWETLPISIYDVEKIELVRGGVSSLYGPNAATGIIHIMTKRAQASSEDTLRVNALGGHYGTKSIHMDFESSFQDVQWRISAFEDSRGRYQDEYYSYAQELYVPIDILKPTRGIDPNGDSHEAQKTRAVSLSVNNDPANVFVYDFSYSHHDSNAHKTYLSGSETPFTTNTAESDAFNLNLNYYNWYSNLSHHYGEQQTYGYPELDHTYQITQTTLEYQYRRPRLIIRPGVRFDEMSYTGDFIGGKQTLRNQSIMLRSEYAPALGSKLVMSTSVDKYNNPDTTQLAYQFSGSHKLNSHFLLRAGLQQSHRSSFFLNSFLDLDFPVLQTPNQRVVFKGDPDAKLLSFRTYELGLRRISTFGAWIEAELFYTLVDDFSEFIQDLPFTENGQTVTPSNLEPIKTHAEQLGATFSWYYLQDNWTLNSFITLQKTKVKDQVIRLEKPVKYRDSDDKGTPTAFGGLSFNWKPKTDWNLNSSIYFMDKSQLLISGPSLTHKASFLTVLNFSLQHKLTDLLNISFTAKNLVNRQKSQSYFTDEIKPSFVVGLSAEL